MGGYICMDIFITLTNSNKIVNHIFNVFVFAFMSFRFVCVLLVLKISIFYLCFKLDSLHKSTSEKVG